MSKLYVVGIGYKPLDKRAGEIIYSSEVILASNRLLEVFKGYEEFEKVKGRIKVINNVDKTIEFIHLAIRNPQSAINNIVLLASGDPLFFGIGRRAVKEFGKDMVEILPDLSSIQVAFARIKEAWDDAFLMSLHGGPDPEKRRRLPYEISDVPALLQRHNKIAILTDKENNPSTIANVIARSETPHLSLRGMESRSNLSSEPLARNDNIRIFVCERLGYPDEKITEGTPEEIAGMEFSEPNVVIIKNTEHRTQNTDNPPTPPFNKGGMGGFADIGFGLREGDIAHSRGLITKDEVRAVAIHKLRLPLKGIFWDIGAGSGSISVEAARLYPGLRVFAVEKDDEQICNIKENKIRFDATNIEIIKGKAPDALTNLPSPERVFIGGSGGKLKEIIDLIAKTQASIAVINAATIETLNEAVQNLEKSGFAVEVSEVSVSRSKAITGKRHMNALNPIFIVIGEKQT
ncbi:MAG: precorrin-6y C5,15-methyltransferase (decarboxylating) subunit CbiE [Thermodesulfovibrionales bacterium]|nr:precorrin-6y C5,15-methyltransferase (decarboxylating) subunit CbiE [Thermodesulfovibrionales bacterium]